MSGQNTGLDNDIYSNLELFCLEEKQVNLKKLFNSGILLAVPCCLKQSLKDARDSGDSNKKLIINNFNELTLGQKIYLLFLQTDI